MRTVIFLAICAVPSLATAQTQTISNDRMSFDSCVASIQQVAGQLGVAPTNIVETTDMRMVRFPTTDGSGDSILVTCSRPDRSRVVSLTSG